MGGLESLESRTFFSVVPAQGQAIVNDLLALRHVAETVRLDDAGPIKAVAADLRLLKHDLHRLKSNSANAALLKTFTASERALAHTLKHDVTVLVHDGSGLAKRAVKDALRVIRKPSDTRAIGRLAVDVAGLAALALGGPAQKLAADAASVQSILTQEVNAIAVANPADTQTQTDTQKTLTAITSVSDKLQADSTTVMSGLSTLVQDLGLA